MSGPRPSDDVARRPEGAGTRLLDIAVARLEAARAMRALGARESALLDTVDRAARGEVPHADAEDALATHLEAREACLDAMRAYDDEWAELASMLAAPGAASDADRASLETTATEIAAILGDIARSDVGFATELAARRQAARAELARTDGARAAGRAYLSQAAGQPEGPRFTDRKG